MSSPTDPPSKNTRSLCYRARDNFYKCVEDLGIDFKPGSPVPSQCKVLRQTFENSCLSSWVEHFDQQREAEARKSKFLHRVINSKKEELAGGLTGKPQS
ncbi:hypothetical protein CEUSTIGMA_g2508.t1 [Chlamydomonas eustigma]|uniref:Cytochrome c oxidase assembly factor 6 n=1 Tax=Chlamydomonas eustigma TaxID=1157962 RepID=A0A250WW46_9CHLO|nr:hypothetical protein CEUSTIGMA_g2508.t1 [Chlamydomonas eustigma]|eukprot:GAX75064.1 hypothetical protein CEUSTIGMA_g2508.t1 [Chlamydomonas eustigma]